MSRISKLLLLLPLLKIINNGFLWLSGKTKWEKDDKIFLTLNKILQGSPELIEDAEKITEWGYDGWKQLRRKYKASRSKTETVDLLFKIIGNAPKEDMDNIKNTIKSAKADLKTK